MSVKHALLALLSDEPSGVYRLRVAFEEITEETWQVNIGQVYSTVQRLERDGLVQSVGTEPATEPGRPDVEFYELTPEGQAELSRWWYTPVNRTETDRDEFAIKLALALDEDLQLAQEVMDTQRFSTLATLQEVNRKLRDTGGTGSGIFLDRQVFLLEAELRWLEHIQALTLKDPISPRSSK